MSNIFNVLRVFIIARALGPQSFGIWNLFNVILAYSFYAEFGMLSGMDKMIPLLRGQSNYSEVESIKNITFTWFNMLYLILVGILIIISFIPIFQFSREVSIGIRLLSIVILLATVQNFYLTILRAEKRFGLIGVTNVTFAISFVVFLLLVYKTNLDKLHATLTAFIGAYIVSLSFCVLRAKLNFKINCDRDKIKKIILTGFPIVIIGTGFVLFTSIDRWIVARYFSENQLGYYAFAVSMSTILYGLVAVFAYVYYPVARENIGKSDNAGLLRADANRLTMIACYFTAGIGLTLMILMPTICHLFFPQYVPGLQIINYVIIGYCFLSNASVSGNLLVAIDKQRYVLVTQFVVAFLVLMLDCFVVRLGLGIEAVAIVTAVSYFLYSACIMVRMLSCVGVAVPDIPRGLTKFYMPIFLSLLAVVIFGFISRFVPEYLVNTSRIIYSILLILLYMGVFFIQMRNDPFLLTIFRSKTI